MIFWRIKFFILGRHYSSLRPLKWGGEGRGLNLSNLLISICLQCQIFSSSSFVQLIVIIDVIDFIKYFTSNLSRGSQKNLSRSGFLFEMLSILYFLPRGLRPRSTLCDFFFFFIIILSYLISVSLFTAFKCRVCLLHGSPF